MGNDPFYDRADLYEAAFSWDPAAEADFVAWALRAALSGARRILEPFCGGGRLLGPLAARGFAVEGFDRNPSMVARARRRAPGARVFQADAAAWCAEGTYDGAFTLIDSFRHLPLEEAHGFLGRLGAALVDGAALVLGLDLAAAEGGGALDHEERWSAEHEGLRVECRWCGTGPLGPRREGAEARLRVLSGGPREELLQRFVLTTWTWAQIEAALAAAGFAVTGGVYDRRYDVARPLRNRVGGVVIVARRLAPGNP